ncbi:hypothetical protein BVY03_04195 [bacterium K02(2017)]|nr:hypothetical protein BVY03_04195 [bacterium K02(2017)]
MSELISHDILENILLNTGAIGTDKVNRILDGEFNLYDFKSTTKKEKVDYSFFDKGFDQIKRVVEENWKEHYIKDIVIEKNPAKITDLIKYKFRDSSFCIKICTPLIEEPFLIYFEKNTYYCLLNDYLGGLNLETNKDSKKLTDIEDHLLKQIINRLQMVMEDAFAYAEQCEFKVVQFDLSIDEQSDLLAEKYLFSEFYFSRKNKNYTFSISMPENFVNYIQDKANSEARLFEKKLDPIWKKTVLGAFLKTDLDLTVSLGKISIPFEKSINLKEGDFFLWDKVTPDVTMLQEDVPRIEGTLGVVEGNFAVQVKDILKF